MEFETVVGIEVHVQLATKTKLFCSCPVAFGEAPNTLVCPVCLGMPGVLPVLNRRALELGLRAAVALGCEVGPRTKFDRKSYYYPDLPKNYQISQYDEPLGRGGRLDVEFDGGTTTVRIRRVHLEEDAGKLIHEAGAKGSLVDLNRTGVPLIEIVSEPDLRAGADSRAYLEELRRTLRYIGVSECNMEEGSMRCEPNISVRPAGSRELGVKTEVKNLNSLRAVQEAIDYEIERHEGLVRAGENVEQQTLLWDAERGRTRLMRSKEEAHDYRYFPEPDLPPVEITRELLEGARGSVGELPGPRRERFKNEYELSDYDIGVLTAEKEVADYFEDVVRAGVGPKSAANWVMQDVLRAAGEKKCPVGALAVTSASVGQLIKLVDGRVIDRSTARDKVFPAMVESGKGPREVIEELGLAMVSDESEIEAVARRVMEEDPKPLADCRRNPRAAMKYIGLVRKASGGRADVQVVRNVIKRLAKETAGLDVEI